MQREQELRDLLYEKMCNEQENFIEKLKHSTPEEIISASYEKVMRDDILMLFESDFLDVKQIKELLRLEYPLSACYNEWLKNDCSYMDMLQNTVDDFSRELVKENEQAKKKKRNQPER